MTHVTSESREPFGRPSELGIFSKPPEKEKRENEQKKKDENNLKRQLIINTIYNEIYKLKSHSLSKGT